MPEHDALTRNEDVLYVMILNPCDRTPVQLLFLLLFPVSGMDRSWPEACYVWCWCIWWEDAFTGDILVCMSSFQSVDIVFSVQDTWIRIFVSLTIEERFL